MDKKNWKAILAKYSSVFDSKLGKYPKQKVHWELKKGTQPVYKRPFPVPHKRGKLFLKELQHLIKEDSLKHVGASKWGAPTFIIPKKDNQVQWILGFCTLNDLLETQQIPLPKIHKVMQKRSNYTHFTKIDLSICFYCFKLDDTSKELYTICTPYGNF